MSDFKPTRALYYRGQNTPVRLGYLLNNKRTSTNTIRFLTGDYTYESGYMTNILSRLCSTPHKSQRLMYKAIAEANVIPSNEIPEPTRPTRQKHPHMFLKLHLRSDIYRYSFIPNTIVDQNALPKENLAIVIAPELIVHFSNNIRTNIMQFLVMRFEGISNDVSP